MAGAGNALGCLLGVSRASVTRAAPECPSEQTRECLYDTGEPAEACGGVCTEAGASCSLNLGIGFEGTCFATETEGAFICGCCEAGEGYEDASGNALPLCMETQLDPPGLI